MIATSGAATALILLAAAGTAPVPDLVEISNPGIDELSGLAVSRADPTLLWGHNDSGGGRWLYRMGRDGSDLGAVRVAGVRASDWEDLAAFEHEGKPALLIADTGDNFSLRGIATLYAVTDPGRTGSPALLWTLPFRFPDGPRDCEAVGVDATRGEILLVSKRDDPPRLYRLALPGRAPRDTQVAEYLGVLTHLAQPGWRERLLHRYERTPTALAIGRDGMTAVVATIGHAYVWRRAHGADWAATLRGAPATRFDLPADWQVEAAALSPDGRDLIVGSEGHPGRLARFALPQ